MFGKLVLVFFVQSCKEGNSTGNRRYRGGMVPMRAKLDVIF